MNEQELRRLIGDVKIGKRSRRGFVQRMAAVGLAAPVVATQRPCWAYPAWMAQPKCSTNRPSAAAVACSRCL